MSASERREEILEAAVSEFAQCGLHGTSTDDIARRAGVSQPYLFRLFGTKKGLFLAALERVFDRVHTAFALAVQNQPDDALHAMGQEYGRLLHQREELLLQMHGYAACGDPDVQELVRRRFGELYEYVERASEASDEEVQGFFARGVLLNVAAAMELNEIRELPWVNACLQRTI
jgi:AcrR family transcriptional regulator